MVHVVHIVVHIALPNYPCKLLKIKAECTLCTLCTLSNVVSHVSKINLVNSETDLLVELRV